MANYKGVAVFGLSEYPDYAELDESLARIAKNYFDNKEYHYELVESIPTDLPVDLRRRLDAKPVSPLYLVVRPV